MLSIADNNWPDPAKRGGRHIFNHLKTKGCKIGVAIAFA
jgi:hypothetical protein